ncbi:S26 family signal peptidase [Pelagerythrobacter aerophilus]|uniref:S26 family signal peptidase n=2 Tax=Pelagerythrobacter aerophilus TaxID=2306995 RepID=A0A418NL32_9SPHN|nr:S26 family signal peptidase [Pelagerythrobacter aerophilus]
MPLLQWGAALRAAKTRRRRLKRKAYALGILATALAITIIWKPRPLLVWNASASAPIGLYTVGGRGWIAPGDMVVARMPEPWRSFAARRRYLPHNVPLVKRVVAVSGDMVCAHGRAIFVNGKQVAARARNDGAGRTMPWWNGCIVLRDDTAFLLMEDNASSFDGRYFGPTSSSDIIGKAQLIWPG